MAEGLMAEGLKTVLQLYAEVAAYAHPRATWDVPSAVLGSEAGPL